MGESLTDRLAAHFAATMPEPAPEPAQPLPDAPPLAPEDALAQLLAAPALPPGREPAPAELKPVAYYAHLMNQVEARCQTVAGLCQVAEERINQAQREVAASLPDMGPHLEDARRQMAAQRMAERRRAIVSELDQRCLPLLREIEAARDFAQRSGIHFSDEAVLRRATFTTPADGAAFQAQLATANLFDLSAMANEAVGNQRHAAFFAIVRALEARQTPAATELAARVRKLGQHLKPLPEHGVQMTLAAIRSIQPQAMIFYRRVTAPNRELATDLETIFARNAP